MLGRSAGKPGPVCGRGWMAKRILRGDPGETVAVSVNVSHSACTASVRCADVTVDITEAVPAGFSVVEHGQKRTGLGPHLGSVTY